MGKVGKLLKTYIYAIFPFHINTMSCGTQVETLRTCFHFMPPQYLRGKYCTFFSTPFSIHLSCQAKLVVVYIQFEVCRFECELSVPL